MRFHWDLTLNSLLRSPQSSARLNTIEFKRGDAAVIELVFYVGAQPVLLAPGHAIRFAIKRKGQHDGEPLVYTGTFTENTDTRTYTASPSFNTAALTALFASPNAPDRLDLMGEFSLRNGDDTQGWQSSQTLNVCVFNDVIRGNEGEPGSVIDPQQSWQWLLASVAAGANVTLTPDPVTRVMTIGAVAGASGNGWSPLLALVPDGERRVLQLTAWIGGSGDAPQGAGQYLGTAGWVSAISDAVDLRGAAGLSGNPGTDGINGLDGRDGNDGMNGSHGWSPIFALVADGERCVLQLTAWIGGSGEAPQGAGQYLGASGLVSAPADALDLRGAVGTDGRNGIDGLNGNDGNHGWTPVLAIVSDGERRVLQLTAWIGGTGEAPQGAGQYLGASGLVGTPAEAFDLRGAAGINGMNGIDGVNGADATPITSISFDGSNLTLQTSTGQSFGPFYVRGFDGTNGNDGAIGNNGWSPLFAVVQDGERRVLQLQSWSGGTGGSPGLEGYYIGPSGLTPYLYEAVDLRGPQGAAGENGSNGADATPITGINFDGSYLTIYTSSGQNFGPFYVRGGDGPSGPPGSDATPITNISFDGYNLSIQTSTGQSFGPFYVRGNDGSSGGDGSPGTNGWSPLFAVIEDGDRRVLQLQSWVGGSGGTPGYEGYYLGPSGFTPYVYEATDIRGPQGSSGEPGSNGADATPITSIDFDGYNLTIHTSSGQSFGPFYVRGSDGSPGADGGSGGTSGADGANGWSPLLSVVPDGARRIIQLQGWTGGSGSSPGNEGSYLDPYGLTWSPGDATDIGSSLQPLAPIDDVSSAVSLSGIDSVDVTMLEAQIADLQSKLQQVIDRLRSHNLISVN